MRSHSPGIVEDDLDVNVLGGGDDLGQVSLPGSEEGPDGAEFLLCIGADGGKKARISIGTRNTIFYLYF